MGDSMIASMPILWLQTNNPSLSARLLSKIVDWNMTASPNSGQAVYLINCMLLKLQLFD